MNNLMKNLLTKWETEEENQKTGGNMPLIDRKHSGNMLLINSKYSGDVLFIERKLAELKDDSKYTSLPKLIELVKKPSNLTKTEKKKPHCPIFYSLAYFIDLLGRLCFCFSEDLAGLTDGLAMGRAKSRRRKFAVGFSR